MPSKYGVYAEDFDNWRERQYTREYALHLARCGKYMPPNTKLDIMHKYYDAMDGRYIWNDVPQRIPKKMNGYENRNQNCSTSDEERNDTIETKTRVSVRGNKSGLSREERLKLMAITNSPLSSALDPSKARIPSTNATRPLQGKCPRSLAPNHDMLDYFSDPGQAQCASKEGGKQFLAKTNKISTNLSGSGCYSRRERDHMASNVIPPINGESMPPMRNVCEGYILKPNVSARERRRTVKAEKRSKKGGMDSSSEIKESNNYIPPEISSSYSDSEKRLAEKVRAISLSQKVKALKSLSPQKVFRAFFKKRHAYIPLKPTFPENLAGNDTLEFEEFAREVIGLNLDFKPKSQVVEAGEFPYDITISEKRPNGNGASSEVSIESFINERLEIHGQMTSSESEDLPDLKFILIVKPEINAERHIEYKGVYRRKIGSNSKYLSYRFTI